MAITLTDSAVTHIKKYLTNREKSTALRIAVKTNGCSGMSYVLEFADIVEESDIIFYDKGIQMIIDPKSLIYVNETELDYGREGLNSGFKFNNPNVKDECGCGESFNI